MDLLDQVPTWLLRPLPANAVTDDKLNERIDQLCQDLPASLPQLHLRLAKVSSSCEYDGAANRAAAHVWNTRERFFSSESPSSRAQLLAFAAAPLPAEALARVCRRLVKDP